MDEDTELDPRIQMELEILNSLTDKINKMELEYDEANTTFRILLNESTKSLKLLSKKLGSCIDRARPYYEALEVARKAQQECRKAAVQFQRANEIHAAAKETVALAEARFMSMSNKWQFDNAWQEMLNHATIKVMEAENEKAESGREHQRRATIFKAAEEKVKHLEDKLQKSIVKSRPYFDEKAQCQEQLNSQKERVERLKNEICEAKNGYAQTMKRLELISNDIHMSRGGLTGLATNEEEMLRGPREPGVGAEKEDSCLQLMEEQPLPSSSSCTSKLTALPDVAAELDKCELRSSSESVSNTPSSALSEKDDEDEETQYEDLDDLKMKFKELAVRPVNGGEGESMDKVWESELKNTADKLDHMMLMQECVQELDNFKSEIGAATAVAATTTPTTTTTTTDDTNHKTLEEQLTQ